MAEPLNEAVQGLLSAFHAEQERIARVEAERQSLAALEEVIAGMKTALVDPSSLDTKIALDSALDAVQIVTSRFDTLLTARDAVGAADGAVAAAQGLLAGDALTAAQQLELLSRFLDGLSGVLKIPGVGPLFAFYVKAIESIVQFVPVIEARAQESARAAEQGADYLAAGREPTAADLEMQRELDEQLGGIADHRGALEAEAEIARDAAAALRERLVAAGIEDPEHTYSTRQQEVRAVVRDALEASGLLPALIALAGTPEYEVPAELAGARAAQLRLDLEGADLTTAERAALQEEAAGYQQWMRDRPTGRSAAYEAAEAERDAARARFTDGVRQTAAPGNWDDSDRRSITSTLSELRDVPGWAPFRAVLQWDDARDGGPDDAWRGNDISAAPMPASGSQSTGEPSDAGADANAAADAERAERALAAMDRREAIGAQLDAQPDQTWDEEAEEYVPTDQDAGESAGAAQAAPADEESDDGDTPMGFFAAMVRPFVEHRVRSAVAAVGVTALVVAGSALALSGGGDSASDGGGGGIGGGTDGTAQAQPTEAAQSGSGAGAAATGTAEPTSTGGGNSDDGGTSAGGDAAPAELLAAFANPGAFMSTTFEGTYGGDGRLASPDAPSWASEVSALAARGSDGQIYVKIEAPAALLAQLCGEVDLTRGTEHVGEGIDWCASGAAAPGYFSNVQEAQTGEASGTAQLVVCTGLEDDDADALVRIWLFRVLEDGGYEAIEFSTRSSSPAVAASDVGFPSGPDGFPHAVYSDGIETATSAAAAPTAQPTTAPTAPTAQPTAAPTAEPTTAPTAAPTATPDDSGDATGGVPAELVPPSSTLTFNGTSATSRLVRFASTATIAELTKFYSAALGEPSDIDGTLVWFADVASGVTTFSLTGTDGAAQMDVVIPN